MVISFDRLQKNFSKITLRNVCGLCKLKQVSNLVINFPDDKVLSIQGGMSGFFAEITRLGQRTSVLPSEYLVLFPQKNTPGIYAGGGTGLAT
jgi:hypothetical protein